MIVVDGWVLFIFNDLFWVGGLFVINGLSGVCFDVLVVLGMVININNGVIDKLLLLLVNDIEDYWMVVYSELLKGIFWLVGKLVFYDFNDLSSLIVCYIDIYQFVNVFFSFWCNLIVWD